MEIARLEVSTQHHLDRMQETAKVNYIQYGKSTKSKMGKKSTQSGASSHKGNRGHGMSSKPSGKGKTVSIPARHLLQMWERQTPKSTGLQSLWMQCVEAVERKDTLRRFISRGNVPHKSLEVLQASTSTAGAGASGEPLYFDDGGQPVHTYMVSVPHVNKHLIKFPIALDYSTLRDRTFLSNCMEYGAWHMEHGWCICMVHCPQKDGA